MGGFLVVVLCECVVGSGLDDLVFLELLSLYNSGEIIISLLICLEV
jgi:hypothetical protein